MKFNRTFWMPADAMRSGFLLNYNNFDGICSCFLPGVSIVKSLMVDHDVKVA